MDPKVAATSGRRSYGQFCGLASALDAVGDRWTLLLVRELLIGPRRFKELAANLPGLGPNLLSERLKVLVELGIVERETSAVDARGRLYTLTPDGEALREPVLALARWGLRTMSAELETREVRAEWGFLAVSSMIVADRVPTQDENYQFEVDDQVFGIEVEGGAARAVFGPVADPVLRMETDAATFVEIGAGLLSPFEAVVRERLKIHGDGDAVGRCSSMLGLV